MIPNHRTAAVDDTDPDPVEVIILDDIAAEPPGLDRLHRYDDPLDIAKAAARRQARDQQAPPAPKDQQPPPAPKERKNPQAIEKALVGLWLAQDALEEFIETMERNPPAADERDLVSMLRDAHGICYALEHHTSMLEGVTVPFPESVQRLERHFRRNGDLDGQQLAALLLRVVTAEAATEDDAPLAAAPLTLDPGINDDARDDAADDAPHDSPWDECQAATKHPPLVRYLWAVTHARGVRSWHGSYADALHFLQTNEGLVDEQAGERREDFWLTSWPALVAATHADSPWDALPSFSK